MAKRLAKNGGPAPLKDLRDQLSWCSRAGDAAVSTVLFGDLLSGRALPKGGRRQPPSVVPADPASPLFSLSPTWIFKQSTGCVPARLDGV